MQLFYAPGIPSGDHILNKEESGHCIKVLRKKQGDEIYITDGAGGLYRASITGPDPRECSFEILEKLPEPQQRDHFLHIAIAPTKNMDRLEWFVEKATEIGIDRITPVICKHSERRKIRFDRLEKIAAGAMKQSGKARLPILDDLIIFPKFISDLEPSGNKYIAYLNEENKYLRDTYNGGKKNLIMIGPEGDFSEEEISLALESGFEGVSLGNARLRTETAGIYACSMINILNS